MKLLMATKIRRMVNNFKGLLLIMLLDHLVTRQGCDLPWWGPTHNVKWLFDHVALQDRVKKWKYIFVTTVSIARNFGRMVLNL